MRQKPFPRKEMGCMTFNFGKLDISVLFMLGKLNRIRCLLLIKIFIMGLYLLHCFSDFFLRDKIEDAIIAYFCSLSYLLTFIYY